MRRILLVVAVFGLSIAGPLPMVTAPAEAYSYAAAGAEPLLDGREALFNAAADGDWTAARAALDGMKADLDYINTHEAPGIIKDFDDALADKDMAALKAAFVRAASAEIERRLNGARDNLDDYQTAKVLVVKAQRFYTAIAGDLAPDASMVIGAELTKALDSIGNPGIFGVGSRKPDPADFEAARVAILNALGREP